MFHTLYQSKSSARECKKKVLKNATGIFKPGLNAILGPTGSGKTSLLDVLAGRKDSHFVSGDVVIDNEIQGEDFRLASGYVVQENIIMETLTVEENLRFSADLRLPKSLTKRDRKRRVDEIIQDLGLSDVAHSKAGNDYTRGISGGEKKRLMIGMELITSPSILFLDEPTTGLDASTAFSVMTLLKKQADSGKMVVFSIHQPRYSIFRLFDTVTLLSDGELVYHGEGSESLPYFERIGYECEIYNNPPDFILDVINHDALRKYNQERGIETIISYTGTGIHSVDGVSQDSFLLQTYEESSTYDVALRKVRAAVDALYCATAIPAVKKRQPAQYKSSVHRQFQVVCHRALVNIFRNPQLLLSQSFVVTFFAILIGLVFLQLDCGPSGLQNRVGVLLFLTMNMVFSNIGAVRLFIQDKALFRHESASGYYRVSTYFLAKVLCDIVALRFIPTIVYAAITYWMIGLVSSFPNFLVYTLTIFLTAVCACSMAFLASASVRGFAVAQLLVIVPTIIMLIFSGVFVNVRTMPSWLSWLKYISVFRYAMSTLLINELDGMVFNCSIDHLSHLKDICTSGNDYLYLQGIDVNQKWMNLVAISSITFGFMVLAYIKLRTLKKFK